MHKIIINKDNNSERYKALANAFEKFGITPDYIDAFNMLYDHVKDYPNSLNYSTLQEQYDKIMAVISVVNEVWDAASNYWINKVNN